MVKPIPLADSNFSLPKLPLKHNLGKQAPPIQIEIAEIIEASDEAVKIKLEFIKEEESLYSDRTNEPKATIELNDLNLKAAMSAFAASLSPSTAALVKMFQPRIDVYDIKISMQKGNINLIEPIKIEWQRFLRDHFSNRQLTLVISEDNTVIQQTRAYTQREQLDEIIKENPIVLDLLKTLNLKLK
ncbi:MAG: hypothetical protein PSX81_01055 [bacterium]|nr:hypothetical protein [bacterium]